MEAQTQTTLLDLIQSVNESACNEEEAIATVAYLINSGRVRLCGNFAGAKINTRPPLDVFLHWIRCGHLPHSLEERPFRPTLTKKTRSRHG